MRGGGKRNVVAAAVVFGAACVLAVVQQVAPDPTPPMRRRPIIEAPTSVSTSVDGVLCRTVDGKYYRTDRVSAARRPEECS